MTFFLFHKLNYQKNLYNLIHIFLPLLLIWKYLRKTKFIEFTRNYISRKKFIQLFHKETFARYCVYSSEILYCINMVSNKVLLATICVFVLFVFTSYCEAGADLPKIGEQDSVMKPENKPIEQVKLYLIIFQLIK